MPIKKGWFEMVTMKEMKKLIVTAFVDMFGFAPTMSKIVPLESCGAGDKIDWLAFAVGGRGYTYDYMRSELERAEQYDCERGC